MNDSKPQNRQETSLIVSTGEEEGGGINHDKLNPRIVDSAFALRAQIAHRES